MHKDQYVQKASKAIPVAPMPSAEAKTVLENKADGSGKISGFAHMHRHHPYSSFPI